VAASGLSWETARRWLEGGRPLSLIALGVLNRYHQKGEIPSVYAKPDREEFTRVLTEYRKRDSAPRPERVVTRLLADAGVLV